MKKIYNKDGTVDIVFDKEKLDNELNKFINTNIHKFNNDIIFLTSSKNTNIKKYDINELLYIWYTAKTELYDRKLSNKNSLFDSTSVYITNKENQKLSSLFALKLYKFIKLYYPNYQAPKKFMGNCVVQIIINLYYNLLSNNKDMQFIENLFVEYSKHN